MAPQTPNDSIYMSAPTSPTRSNMADEYGNTMDFFFYSMSPSPIRNLHNKDAQQPDQPTTPTGSTYQDANSSFDDDEDDDDDDDDDDFEFATIRRRFVHDEEKERIQGTTSFPAMAFADELFRDGKLVMPLKLPPRLQYKFGYRDSQLLEKTSPYSSSSLLSKTLPYSSSSLLSSSSSSSSQSSVMMKIPFSGRRMLWNDDYDPFMAALDNVKQEKRSSATNHRRARSLSPLRTSTINDQLKRLLQPWIHHSNQHQKPAGRKTDANHEMGNKDHDENNLKFAERTSMKLAEPRGVLLFARRGRMVKMTSGERSPAPAAREESENRESKTQKIKKLLIRSVSAVKARSEEDEEDEELEGGESKLKSKSKSKGRMRRKFSLKKSYMGLIQYKRKQRGMSQITKMTIMQYRPKLLLCIGFGSKFVK